MKKLILDLDTGVDDALAISYALGSPEIELIGIAGTYGNVLVEQGVRNALAVTDLLGHPEVKVYQGLPHSSTTDHFDVLPISAFIHGENGIGDVTIPDSNRSVETESAVDFIIDAVKTYGKDLVYVPTGPMTNIAAALDKAPEIKGEIGEIVLMGGALTVPGNVNAWTEANISQDPDAADRLFRSGAPVTMIGLDVTLQTLLTYKETQQWRELGTKAGTFLADMTDYYIKAYETTAPHLGGCGLHDPLGRGRGGRSDARDHARHQHEGRCGRPDPWPHHRRRNQTQRCEQDHEGGHGRGCAEVPERVHDAYFRACQGREIRLRALDCAFRFPIECEI